MYCPYVNCSFFFFLHCLEHCKCSSAVFLHCLSICKLFVVFCTVCPYVNCCCCFFCAVWSTLIRISLTKALVLWWCDNKSDLIWFWFDFLLRSALWARGYMSVQPMCQRWYLQCSAQSWILLYLSSWLPWPPLSQWHRWVCLLPISVQEQRCVPEYPRLISM